MLTAVLVCFLVVVLAAAPIAVITACWGGSRHATRSRRAAAALAVGAAAALALAVSALAGTTTELPGLAVTPFSGLVLVLVYGMGATVLGFASRSLRDEPYQQRFTVFGASLVGTGTLLALTTNLLVLGAVWVTTSLLTVALIRTGPVEGAGTRTLRARRAFVVGDLALVAAVGALIATTGDLSIAAVGSVSGPVLAGAGILLVVAAATRSAAGPFFRWLPDSLGAPTPSSALLHAGVVNAGAVLMIKLAPAVAGTAPGAATAVVLGGLTCVIAEAVMLTRPDVKGRLAWSTTAQMAFTMVLCGLGLPVAAGLHLVAHGFYKGALFLGSGSAVRVLVRQRTAPAAKSHGVARDRLTMVAAFAAVGASMIATGLLAGVAVGAVLAVPLGLAWVAAGCATAAWLSRAGTPGQRVAAVVMGTSAASLFLIFTAGLDHAVAPSLTRVDPALSAWWVLPVLAGLVLVATTRAATAGSSAVAKRAWTIARSAGRPTLPTRRTWFRPFDESSAPPRPLVEPSFNQLTGV